MPVTPVAAVASSKPGSSDQRSEPMTLIARLERRRDRCGRARSRPARRAGRRRSARPRRPDRSARSRRAAGRRLPSTISALVPTSTSSVISSFTIGRLGEDHARRVGADMAGDAGQGEDARAGRDVEAEVAGRASIGAVDGEREGRAAELDRIEAEEEVMHDRVADRGHLENVVARRCRLPSRRCADQAVDRLAHDRASSRGRRRDSA